MTAAILPPPLCGHTWPGPCRPPDPAVLFNRDHSCRRDAAHRGDPGPIRCRCWCGTQLERTPTP